MGGTPEGRGTPDFWKRQRLKVKPGISMANLECAETGSFLCVHGDIVPLKMEYGVYGPKSYSIYLRGAIYATGADKIGGDHVQPHSEADALLLNTRLIWIFPE